MTFGRILLKHLNPGVELWVFFYNITVLYVKNIIFVVIHNYVFVIQLCVKVYTAIKTIFILLQRCVETYEMLVNQNIIGSFCLVLLLYNCPWNILDTVAWLGNWQYPYLLSVAERPVIHAEKKPGRDRKPERPSGTKVTDGIQGDGPWWINVGDTEDLCSKPLPTDAVACKDLRKRWHYNRMTGKCELFYGCPTHGNNFARKRYCKEQCRYPLMKPTGAKATSGSEDKVCFNSLPDKAFTCSNAGKSKRWHYNAKTGRCEKFFGCPTSGNNFAKKVACKSKCQHNGRYTRFSEGKNLEYTSCIQTWLSTVNLDNKVTIGSPDKWV